nr:LuxR C-terminal-related transcriptional regulator [Bradyrhizobium zhengyangense]
MIDRIYEASVIPSLWVDVLDRISAVARCDGGILIAADPSKNVHAVSSKCLSPMLRAFVEEGWMHQNIRAARLAPLNYSGFVVDLDIVTPEEAETDPLYVNCLRKHGGGVGTGTVIPAPTGDLIIFNIERSYRRGFVDRSVLTELDALRPHLARSALLSVRLGLERARAMTDAMERLNLPAAVLTADGRALSTNALLDRMEHRFISGAGGRLLISHRPANDLLKAALANTEGRVSVPHTYSIPIPALDDLEPCVAHLVPIRRQARDIFSGAAHLLVVTSITTPSAPPAHILHGLFDLTPAEAKVAQNLFEGRTVEEIATAHSLSRETIRKQLKAVLTKTGTNRQSELVGLLSGVQIRAHG